MDDVKRFIILTGLVLMLWLRIYQPMSEPELQAYTNKVFYEISHGANKLAIRPASFYMQVVSQCE